MIWQARNAVPPLFSGGDLLEGIGELGFDPLELVIIEELGFAVF
jgi:hypothetical protein